MMYMNLLHHFQLNITKGPIEFDSSDQVCGEMYPFSRTVALGYVISSLPVNLHVYTRYRSELDCRAKANMILHS